MSSGASQIKFIELTDHDGGAPCWVNTSAIHSVQQAQYPIYDDKGHVQGSAWGTMIRFANGELLLKELTSWVIELAEKWVM